jgi:hypothetical protein
MPTRKIADLAPPMGPYQDKHPACYSAQHNPPTHMVFEPGVYEHECPSCGHKVTFTVSRVSSL